MATQGFGPMDWYKDEEDDRPEAIRLSEAFQDAEDKKPGADEALRGLSSLLDNEQPAPISGQAAEMQDVAKDVGKDGGGKKGINWAETLMLAAPGIAAGIGGATGNKGLQRGAAAAQGMVTRDFMEARRNEQQEKLRRRQTAWNDTYEMAKSIPPEILADPKFADLAAATQAFQKDMADGSVDNEKTLANFQTQAALYRQEIEDALAEHQATREFDVRQRQDQMGADRDAQILAEAEEIQKAGGQLTPQHQEALARKGQYVTTDQGEVVSRETADRNRMHQERLDARSSEHAAQMEATNRRIAMWEEENNLRRQQIQQAKEAGDRYGVLRGHATILSGIDAAAQADAKFEGEFADGDPSQIYEQKLQEQIETKSDDIIEAGIDTGLLYPISSNEQTDAFRVEGSQEPVHIPNAEFMRGLKQRAEQLTAVAQQLEARGAEGQATPHGEGLIGGQGQAREQTGALQAAKRAAEQAQAQYMELYQQRQAILRQVYQTTMRLTAQGPPR